MRRGYDSVEILLPHRAQMYSLSSDSLADMGSMKPLLIVISSAAFMQFRQTASLSIQAPTGGFSAIPGAMNTGEAQF